MVVALNYYTDKEGIENFSNPKIVQEKARQHGLDVVYSPRKNKKYRIVNPLTNEYVDFGQMGYEDFTLHQDEERRRRFRQRNHRWQHAPKYSPAYLSFHWLW